MTTASAPDPCGPRHDCKPTLNDQQVFEFCRRGYLVLEGVVNAAVNDRMMAFIDEHPGHQPLKILDEDWFVDGVLKNPQAAGAARCLLGRDFYYPQDTPAELGPTEVIPGSHFMRSKANHMGHIQSVRMTQTTSAPAGSIFITVYSIWHRKGKSTAGGFRNLIKYNYWRTTEPRRDWITDPAYGFSWPDMASEEPHFEQFKCGIAAAEMFSWLSGEEYEHSGGQCWPCESPAKSRYPQPGLPGGLAGGEPSEWISA